MSKKRLVLIANKSWEVEPLMNALLNERFCKERSLLKPDILNYPFKFAQGQSNPRAVWQNINDTIIELWCVQDIMDIPEPIDKDMFSSSEVKFKSLSKILNYSSTKPSLFVALGTAGCGDQKNNNNGSVSMGSSIFIHDFHPENNINPKSKLRSNQFGKLITSTVNPEIFSILNPNDINSITSGLLKPFNNPSEKITCLINSACGISVVNITDYKDYEHSDIEAIDAFKKISPNIPLGSVETTHGVIRLMCDSPFIFISGITDRVGFFADDVNGKDSLGNKKTEAQNFTSAFNVGVFLATLLNKKDFYNLF